MFRLQTNVRKEELKKNENVCFCCFFASTLFSYTYILPPAFFPPIRCNLSINNVSASTISCNIWIGSKVFKAQISKRAIARLRSTSITPGFCWNFMTNYCTSKTKKTIYFVAFEMHSCLKPLVLSQFFF